MPKFEMEISLPVCPENLSADLLVMSGVNYELSPILKMSAPQQWPAKPISEWPVNDDIFSSIILLFGFIPVDLHRFKFRSVNSMGFIESSKTMLNNVWSHEQTISADGSGAKIRDVVYFKSKLGFLGYLFKPVFQSIFAHRHKRLKSKYAKSS
ncbi:hypothetical protein A3752_19745 [Oleiphilus sp. HI0081]|nr:MULTISPECIES: hypothetical protein [unclassified Oleiphilus]KZY75281.1 hypothetical protein A3741_12435 [Oleiphilus sp. HI0069]KZY76298.1 hypothetical protein A3740_13185 [Oleiphilus sp. HI0068]KZY88831.1 hypothetical protein A3743_10345 [Oleiphilus sp. HI0072]KZZ29137.1 hypothetical protein A3752_19745 [Oleiphilus sp. HI0081]KZY35348.1 hypothetical protein A3729_17520 [Oleiphilus sp. HI0043]